MPSMSSETQMRRVLYCVVGQRLEGVAHHGGARHFAERADVRQAGGAVAGLEDHRRILRPAAFSSLSSAPRRACSNGQALAAAARAATDIQGSCPPRLGAEGRGVKHAGVSN